MLPTLPTIPDQIREARQHVETGDIEAAKALIREILASVDRMLDGRNRPPWPRRVLQVVRLQLAKAGRAILTSDFVFATTALNEAIRALEKPAAESHLNG